MLSIVFCRIAYFPFADVADTQLLLWNGIKSEGRESERIFSLALQKIEQNSFLVVRIR